MSKFNSIQNSFGSGEISRRLDGRTDLDQYSQALETLDNFLVLRGGGVSKRPSFRYIVNLVDALVDGAALIPFIFSRTESYLVVLLKNEISSKYIKVYKNDGTEVTVSDLSFHFATVTNYDPKKWQIAQSADVLFLTYADRNIPMHVLSRISENNFNFDIYGSAIGNTSFKLLTTTNETLWRPFLDPNIDPNLVMVLSAVAVGTRTVNMQTSGAVLVPFFTPGHTFSTGPNGIFKYGAYFKATASSVTGSLYISDAFSDLDIADGGIVTGTDILTSVAHALQTGDNVIARLFNAGPPTGITLGTTYFIRRLGPDTFTLHPTLADAQANTNITNITAVNGGGIKLEKAKLSTVTCVVVTAFNAALTAGSDDWEESAWSGEQGFPGSVTIHEQRLTVGGSLKNPDTIYSTKVGNFFHFMESKFAQDASTDSTSYGYFGAFTSDDPYQFQIASNEVNAIQWLSSLKTLQIGTLGTEYIADGGPDQIISRNNVSVVPQTNHGSVAVQPVKINDALYFVSRDGKRLRDFSFSNDSRGFISSNISLLNNTIIKHLFDGLATSSVDNIELDKLIYQESRGILWMVTSLGALIAITLDKDSEIVAWHRHTIGGAGVFVQSAVVIPNSTGTFDDLWILVKRTINGSAAYYLEKMGGDFEHVLLKNSSTDDNDHPWFSDSSKRIKITALPDLTVSSVSTALNQLTFGSAHGLEDGHSFTIASSGTIPGGLAAATTYYAGKVSNTVISVTASLDEANQFIPTMTFVDGNVTVGTDQIDLTSHAYVTGDPVVLTTTGTLPAGLATSTTYYVIRISASVIKFASTLANANLGTAIDITAASGGGTHSISPLVNRAIDITSAGSGTITLDLMGAATFNVDHLIGQEVSILADGFNVPRQTVSAAGTITLSEVVEEVIVGLPYTAKLKTLRLEAGKDHESSQGMTKRIDRVIVRFFDSLSAKVGSAESFLEEVEFRPSSLGMGQPVPLYTGDKVVYLTASPDREAQVLVQSSEPLPTTVVALMYRGVSYD